MIRLEDRLVMVQGIAQAHAAGSRLMPACELASIAVRTLQRWKAADDLVRGDRRPGADRETPAHALSAAERARLLQVTNEPRFADVPPAHIVPMLADEGIYLASESSVHRVLRVAGSSGHRGRAKAPQAIRPPTTHMATEPNRVWCCSPDVLASHGDWELVLSVPDSGPVQPQDRWLGGVR